MCDLDFDKGWYAVSLTDEPNDPVEIVVHIGANRAIAIAPETDWDGSRWGNWLARVTAGEWASVLRTLDPATRAYVESQRLSGRLVELDDISRAMWSTAKKIVEEDGWVQATLRNDRGHVARHMRIRPADGIAAMTGGAAILGAIAAQAQTAEMARNIAEIRHHVADIYQHLQTDQVGAVNNVSELVQGVVLRLREHGADGIEVGEIAVIRTSLGDARHKCLGHLKDAVTRLERAERDSPRHAAKGITREAVDEVALYLDLLRSVHWATVELELAQVAVHCYSGKVDMARTCADSITTRTGQMRSEIDEVCERIGVLDERTRATFRSVWDHAVKPDAATGAVAVGFGLASYKMAGTKTIKVRGIPIPMSALGAVGSGALTLGGGGALNAVVQPMAQKKLDTSLSQLTDAASRTSETIEQTRPSLDFLTDLTEELCSTDD